MIPQTGGLGGSMDTQDKFQVCSRGTGTWSESLLMSPSLQETT